MINNSYDPQFDDLAEEFAQRIRKGERPQVAQYADANPDLATQINRLFPVLEMMEQRGVECEDMSESGLIQAEIEQLQAAPKILQLGDFRIIREIGRGGMGIVFEAEQESLGRRVALKLLPASAQFDDRRLERFKREALASAKLHHTNIVQVFGVGQQDDTSYFVMQLIEGQPLNSVITELSRIRSGSSVVTTNSTEAVAGPTASTIADALSSLPPPFNSESESKNELNRDESSELASHLVNDGVYWRNIATLGIQVGEALAHAHSKQLLHRDIKPGNLLIDRGGVAWVTDFGLAKYFESPDLTKTGEVVGTLRYMSPEQLNGKADERSDIFALGLTLYELAGLRPAYDKTEKSQLLKQVLAASPKPLRQLNRQVPRDLETIVHKCVAAEPDQRYQTADELTLDLNRFLDGEPVVARRINPMERVVKWCKRQPVVAALSAALLASLIAGIVGVSIQWKKTQTALEQASLNLTESNKQTRLAKDNFEEAKRQTKVAREHFKQARESVDRYFSVISQERLLNEPGFTKLRRDLLQEGLNYHQQFAAQYSDDESMQLELAKSLHQIAQIEGKMRGAPDLHESLDKPISIFSKLMESDPAIGYNLARSQSLKADFLKRLDIDRAMELMQTAIGTLDRIPKKELEHQKVNFLLAEIHQKLGLMYEMVEHSTGKPGKSLEHYSSAHTLMSEIVAGDPEEIQCQVRLASLDRDLAITHRRKGNQEKAIEFYDQAIGTLSPLVDANPNYAHARYELASIANSFAYLHGKGSTDAAFDKALEYYELAREHYQTVSDQNPMVLQYRRGLSNSLRGIASVQQVRGDLVLALSNRVLATDIAKELWEKSPKATHMLSSYAQSLSGVASTLRDLEQYEDSVSKINEAISHHLTTIDREANQPLFKMRLVESIQQLVRANCAAGDFDQAFESMELIDEHVPEDFSKAQFIKGKEYTLVASKIGKQLSTEKSDALLVELRTKCLDVAREALTQAQRLGFDVVQWSKNDADLTRFAKEHPESQEMLNWIEENLGQ